MSGLCGKELINLRQNTSENIVEKGEMPVTSIFSQKYFLCFPLCFSSAFILPKSNFIIFILFILLSPNLFNFKDSEEAFRKHYGKRGTCKETEIYVDSDK